MIPLLSPQGWDYVLLVSTPAVHAAARPARRVRAGRRAGCCSRRSRSAGLTFWDVLGREPYRALMMSRVVTVGALFQVWLVLRLRARARRRLSGRRHATGRRSTVTRIFPRCLARRQLPAAAPPACADAIGVPMRADPPSGAWSAQAARALTDVPITVHRAGCVRDVDRQHGAVAATISARPSVPTRLEPASRASICLPQVLLVDAGGSDGACGPAPQRIGPEELDVLTTGREPCRSEFRPPRPSATCAPSGCSSGSRFVAAPARDGRADVVVRARDASSLRVSEVPAHRGRASLGSGSG